MSSPEFTSLPRTPPLGSCLLHCRASTYPNRTMDAAKASKEKREQNKREREQREKEKASKS